MGSAARRRRRAAAAQDGNLTRDSNKFILPSPRDDKTEPPRSDVADGKSKNLVGNRVSKRKAKRKKLAGKSSRRVGAIVTDPDVAEVTVQWMNGATETFHLKDRGNGAATLAKEQDEKKDRPVTGDEPGMSTSCGMPSNDNTPSPRTPSIKPQTLKTSHTETKPPASVGPNSLMAQETQPSDPLPALRDETSDLLPEIANSQASEESFHDSQEYPPTAERDGSICSTRGGEYPTAAEQNESVCSVQGTEPLSEARRADSPVLENSPVLGPVSEYDGDREANHAISSPLAFMESLMRLPEPRAADHEIPDTSSEASQDLPALHPEPEHPPSPAPPTTSDMPSPRNKRGYDPYELTPTPPKKRILRSSGKVFATPPWNSGTGRTSSPAPGAAKSPRWTQSGLIPGKPAISEAELVAIFSDPDPKFDKFDGVRDNLSVPPVGDEDTAAGAHTPGLPPNGEARKSRKVNAPPRRAVRKRKVNKEEMSDDTSYSELMSTPLGKYGRAPHVASQPRPVPLTSTQQSASTKGGAGSKTRRRSSTGSHSFLSKTTAAMIAELPTSSVADSMTGSSPSMVSTRATSPAEESVSKPVEAVKPETKTQGVSMVLGIPSGRRRSSMSAPGMAPFAQGVMPSAAGVTPSKSSAASIRGSWRSGSSPERDVQAHAPTDPATETAHPQIEIPIPLINAQGAKASKFSQSKLQAEENRDKSEKTTKKSKKKKRTGDGNQKEARPMEEQVALEDETLVPRRTKKKSKEEAREEAPEQAKPVEGLAVPTDQTPVPRTAKKKKKKKSEDRAEREVESAWDEVSPVMQTPGPLMTKKEKKKKVEKAERETKPVEDVAPAMQTPGPLPTKKTRSQEEAERVTKPLEEVPPAMQTPGPPTTKKTRSGKKSDREARPVEEGATPTEQTPVPLAAKETDEKTQEAKPVEKWVPPMKQTPVPLPPYVTMARRL